MQIHTPESRPIPSRNQIVETVLQTALKILDQLPAEERKPFHPTSDLFGGSSPFDSLNLVTFIVELEQDLERNLGCSVTLADERAMSQPTNPFRTVSSLTDYIQFLLIE